MTQHCADIRDLATLFTPAAEGSAADDPLFVLNLRTARVRVEHLCELAPNMVAAEDLDALVAAWRDAGFDQSYPRIADLEKRAAQEARLSQLSAHDRERAELRQRIQDRFGRVELRGLQLSERILQDIDHIYVPLHVGEEREQTIVVEKQEVITRITERVDVRTALEQKSRLLILGAPGSGKSTLTSFLAVAAAARKVSDKPDQLPFVVLARSLHGAKAITTEVIAEQNGVSVTVIDRALASGEALVLVDGLDESTAAADSLLESLGKLTHRAHAETRWLVTSRILGAPGPDAVERSGFQVRSLLSMTRSEVEDFVHRWCKAAETSITTDTRVAMTKAEAAAIDLLGRIERTPTVAKLAENPLMCSVVCTLHRFLGQRIPERRAALYEAAANLLLYDWDRSKFDADAMLGTLDAAQKRALLASIAFEMHRQEVAEIPAAKLVAAFERGLPEVGAAEANANAIVDEIRARSGLLVERGTGVYGFSHLTFQEYFAACEVVRRQAWDEIARQAGQPWWHEVIVLAAGIPGANAVDVIERLLRRGDVGLVLAAQCVDAAATIPKELRQRVTDKTKNLIPPRDYGEIERLISVGVACGPLVLEALNTSNEHDVVCLLLPVVERLELVGAISTLERYVMSPERHFWDEHGLRGIVVHNLAPGLNLNVPIQISGKLHASLALFGLSRVSDRALEFCVAMAERGEFDILTHLVELDALTPRQKRVKEAALKARAAHEPSPKPRARKRAQPRSKAPR